MKNKNPITFAILGLSKFGMSILRTLFKYNIDVLACDKNESKLQNAKNFATHLILADISDENALNGIGLGNFDIIILDTGNDFEASQIATMFAKEKGAKKVIVKANNIRQKIILEKLGADEVILPEIEAGRKLAIKLMNPNIIDVLNATEDYSITEMHPFDEWVGKTVQEADIRNKHNITIFAVQQENQSVLPISINHIISKDDILFVMKSNDT